MILYTFEPITRHQWHIQRNIKRYRGSSSFISWRFPSPYLYYPADPIPPFPPFLLLRIINSNYLVTYWITRSYLAGLAAAKRRRWHQSLWFKGSMQNFLGIKSVPYAEFCRQAPIYEPRLSHIMFGFSSCAKSHWLSCFLLHCLICICLCICVNIQF